MTSPSRTEPIEKATGRSWDTWLAFMQRIDAEHLSHKQIAEKVTEELAGVIDNPGWWAQGITVAYEQHTGRRLPGQMPDGTFQASVSRVTALGLGELMDAWTAFAAADAVVLQRIAGEPRVSGTDKRITWRVDASDGSKFNVASDPKRAGAPASLVVTQTGIPTQEASAAAKQFWTEVVARFLAGLSE